MKRCPECGEILWSKAARDGGVHPECAEDLDPPVDVQDLEEQLAELIPPAPVDLHQRIAERYLFRGIFEKRKESS